MNKKSHFPWYMGGLFLFGRLVAIMTRPAPRIWPFYELSQMGWPYANYWPEYPPVFPLVSRITYLVAGGKEHVYGYILAFVFTIAHAVTVVVFAKLAYRIFQDSEAREVSWLYLAFALIVSTAAMPFDVIAVTFMLLGLFWALEAEEAKAGLAIGAGILTKWFPLFSLAAVWATLPKRSALKITIVAIGLTAAVFGGLYLAFPANTVASMKAAAYNGSWETVWALIDGNYQTGNYGVPLSQMLDPANATLTRRNPARIPRWATLIVFGGIGLWGMMKAKPGKKEAVSFLGLTWCLFALWTPGWTPAWVIYMVPLILLALPRRKAVLFALTLTAVSFLEWPVLLSRGMFYLLPVPVVVRTALLVLLATQFWQVAIRKIQPNPLR